MKFYSPKAHKRDPDRDGFTAEEVRSGTMFLYADVQCENCNHVMSLAAAGSSDRGKCTRWHPASVRLQQRTP